MEQFGRPLIVIGVALTVVGVLIAYGPRLPFGLGRLPLDFSYRRGNFSFYFPLGTTILLSIVLSLVLAFLNRR
jgi:uncharacterized integral membrane protein